MNTIKRILIACSIFIGISAHAAEVAPEKAELVDIRDAIDLHISIKPVARIINDYYVDVVMFFYPTNFERFCDLDKYEQKEIIKTFGMAHPHTECCSIVRCHLSAGSSSVSRIPVSIFDGKKDEELLYTGNDEYLGHIRQEEYSYTWPDLHRTIACWSRITQAYRERPVSHDELIKLMQSY